jgi:hypothetical protein
MHRAKQGIAMCSHNVSPQYLHTEKQLVKWGYPHLFEEILYWERYGTLAVTALHVTKIERACCLHGS